MLEATGWIRRLLVIALAMLGLTFSMLLFVLTARVPVDDAPAPVTPVEMNVETTPADAAAPSIDADTYKQINAPRYIDPERGTFELLDAGQEPRRRLRYTPKVGTRFTVRFTVWEKHFAIPGPVTHSGVSTVIAAGETGFVLRTHMEGYMFDARIDSRGLVESILLSKHREFDRGMLQEIARAVSTFPRLPDEAVGRGAKWREIVFVPGTAIWQDTRTAPDAALPFVQVREGDEATSGTTAPALVPGIAMTTQVTSKVDLTRLVGTVHYDNWGTNYTETTFEDGMPFHVLVDVVRR